jgi:hypothetical protein
MSLDVAQRADAARRRFWTIATVGLGSVLLVTTGLVLLWGGDAQAPAAPKTADALVSENTENELGSSDQSQGGGSPGHGPAAAAWVPPARQVTLPAGTDQIDELPVGFPQTPEGAAAAEVAKDRYSSTLDYHLANTVARVYLAPELATTADDASTAAVADLRARLGVAELGPPSAEASVATRPIAVQWVTEGDERTEVSVLVQVDYRIRQKAWSEIAASTTVWQWMEESGRPADWRLVGARRPAADLTRIGTAAFNDTGWSAIVTETAR